MPTVTHCSFFVHRNQFSVIIMNIAVSSLCHCEQRVHEYNYEDNDRCLGFNCATKWPGVSAPATATQVIQDK